MIYGFFTMGDEYWFYAEKKRSLVNLNLLGAFSFLLWV